MEAQPTQSSWIYDFLAWLEINKTRVLTGLLILAVAAAGIAVYFWQKNQSEVEANEALFAVAPGLGQKTMPAEDYAKIAQEHPRTSAAERAELLATSALFSRGDYAKAQSLFEKFLVDRPDSPFLAQAAFGVAASLEGQGKVDLAVTKYEEVARTYPTASVAAQAKLALGRIYESRNQPDKALSAYSELEKSPTAMDMWKSEAIDRRDKVLARHPELRKEVTSRVISSTPDEQIIEVTTPPEPTTPAPTTKKP